MKEQDLAGRHALVTGAGRGIGRAIALELAQRGAQVVACSRDAGKLEETHALAKRFGGKVSALAADITAPNFLHELSRGARAIDIVVHNAMWFPPYATLEDARPQDVALAHEVVVLAPMRITAHLLPDMKARGFGRVIFIGSIAASVGAAQQAPYASAKAALHGLAKSLALEGAKFGITCNVIEPGLVMTERVMASIPDATRANLVARTPMGRAGTAEEVAAVAGFLASPRASYVTGACIPVTGGLGLGVQ
ncbi:MAG: SDR family NAD(P)-dependent oxidoreductase [Planctomycetota bacterium]|nr:SDR family NAD(P)-dependent oxidoreductase [Planctomycetota bacterium]